MDPDTINCVILRIHEDKNNNSQPCHLTQTSVSASYGSEKISCWLTTSTGHLNLLQRVEQRRSLDDVTVLNQEVTFFERQRTVRWTWIVFLRRKVGWLSGSWVLTDLLGLLIKKIIDT